MRCRTLRTECVGLGAGSLCLGVCGLQGGGEGTGSLCFRGLRAPEGWVSVSRGIVDGGWVSASGRGGLLGLCASESVSLVRGEASCRGSQGNVSLLLSEVLLEGKEQK